MKRKKFTGVMLMLATAVVSTAMGGALLARNAVAEESTTASLYSVSSIFSTTDAEITSENVENEEITAFKISDDGKVTMTRNLALAWYEAKNVAKYFSMSFSFKELNFDSVSITMDSPSAWATKDNKATNVVTFEKASDAVVVYVNKDMTQNAVNTPAATIPTADATGKITLSLAESQTGVDGEFAVKISVNDVALTMDESVSKFVNVGANYATYSYEETLPLTISVDSSAEEPSVILLTELNGQTFKGLQNGKVKDNAAPVLVVNEEIDGFLLGTAFDLDYQFIDVLVSTNKLKSKEVEFYQYNPTLKEGDEKYESYKTLSSSTYFMATTYEKEDGTETTVFNEEIFGGKSGQEFVSIIYTLKDVDNEMKYDLSWYVKDTALAQPDASKANKDYIVVNKNEAGAYYTFVTKNDSTKTNTFDEASFNAAKASFEEALADKASKVYAGSNAEIEFPSFRWFINDNNGYRNLKFVICYKSRTTESTTSEMAYNDVTLSVPSAGKYEFKIFAKDEAGNTMKYYLDGEEVSVAANNIWDIHEIPSFTFEIFSQGLKVEDPSSSSGRKDTEVLNKTYDDIDFTVVGANSLSEEYKLYKVDLNPYNATAEAGKTISQSLLSNITYESIKDKLTVQRILAVEDGDYFGLYLDIYTELLAERVGVIDPTTKTVIRNCFKEIKEYDSRITESHSEWNEYNKYKWSPSEQSFKTVEVGTYLVMGDFYEKDLSMQRATAYQLVVVSTEEDIIKGESDWLKNNTVSVVLFSVAGVMLILIVILLLIKPSDETLEDVDAQAAVKKEKTKKKNK